jgi:hypothetical protein
MPYMHCLRPQSLLLYFRLSPSPSPSLSYIILLHLYLLRHPSVRITNASAAYLSCRSVYVNGQSSVIQRLHGPVHPDKDFLGHFAGLYPVSCHPERNIEHFFLISRRQFLESPYVSTLCL